MSLFVILGVSGLSSVGVIYLSQFSSLALCDNMVYRQAREIIPIICRLLILLVYLFKRGAIAEWSERLDYGAEGC